jgi:hypothetical protein
MWVWFGLGGEGLACRLQGYLLFSITFWIQFAVKSRPLLEWGLYYPHLVPNPGLWEIFFVAKLCGCSADPLNSRKLGANCIICQPHCGISDSLIKLACFRFHKVNLCFMCIGCERVEWREWDLNDLLDRYNSNSLTTFTKGTADFQCLIDFLVAKGMRWHFPSHFYNEVIRVEFIFGFPPYSLFSDEHFCLFPYW